MVWRKVLPKTRRTPVGTVYLLHFDRPIGTEGRGAAQHYVGFTIDPEQRFEQHLRGNGSKLVAVAMAQGVSIQLAGEWTGVDQTFEFRLKNRGGMKRVCKICNPNRKPYPQERKRGTTKGRAAKRVGRKRASQGNAEGPEGAASG